MSKVEVIRANSDLASRKRGKEIKQLRVAAYCRVSTDSEDRLNSYKSQVSYYSDLIQKNVEWVLADIYADEAITGTQVTKREDFQLMINDCMNGDIDMVITKSISRFARNTLDTLKYVRMLKERDIAVCISQLKSEPFRNLILNHSTFFSFEPFLRFSHPEGWAIHIQYM